MEENKITEFIKNISVGYQTISFEDNNKGKKYTITKDDNNNKYIIETLTTKEINTSDKLDKFFEDMNNYFESINEKDYWPTENEYPDLYILWRICKSSKEELYKSGTIKYPDDWNIMLEKFKEINNK